MLPTKHTSENTVDQLMQVCMIFYGPLNVEITQVFFCKCPQLLQGGFKILQLHLCCIVSWLNERRLHWISKLRFIMSRLKNRCYVISNSDIHF